jgi:PAS domain S-box-containing protein
MGADVIGFYSGGRFTPDCSMMSAPCRVSPLAGERALVATYAAAALLWIAATWLVSERLGLVMHRGTWVDVGLDGSFVAVSGVLIFFLLRRLRHKHDAVAARETAALREQARSAHLLQTLADNSPDAIFAKDSAGRYLLFNRAAAKFVGADASAVLGRDDSVFFPTQFASIRARDDEIMRLEQPQTFEEQIDTVNGSRTFLTTKGSMRDEHGVVGLFGIARDITERVRARQQLMLSEQRFRLAAAGGHVWDWDVAGQVAESQTSFWCFLGHEPPAGADALRLLQELMHPHDLELWQAALQAHIVARAPYEIEFRARHRNGHWRWFRTQGQAVWDDAGRATYMAGTTFDVTDRRLAEDALLRTQSELSCLTRRLMEQERETTTRLAQTLHDHLGQTLSSARLHLDLALGQPAARGDRLERVSSLLDDAIGEVRRVLVELRPPLLHEQGLAAALRNELRRSAAADLDVAVRLDAGAVATSRWPDTVEHAAFMIAREGLANALQHACATEVSLALSGDGRRLDLRVEDNGHGITDDERHGRPGHLGLVGMRERAASIGAVLTMERRASGGTCVRLRWPCDPG